MGKAKKLKMIRKAVQNLAPEVPFELLKPHYKKMKKIIMEKGGEDRVTHPLH